MTSAPAWLRLVLRVERDPSGCWLWRGVTTHDGYGRIYVARVDGKQVQRMAHRVAYEAFIGPIPPSLTLDHLCRVRACVNPAHLEPVTQRENLNRSPLVMSAVNGAKTHCPQGHAYDEANTYTKLRNGRPIRTCRTCSVANRRASRAAARAATDHRPAVASPTRGGGAVTTT